MKKILTVLAFILLPHAVVFSSAWSADDSSVLDFIPAIMVEKKDPPPVDDGRQDCTNLYSVTLNAFTDFSCTSNWTYRDGALGLKAYSGSGSCVAKFPGNPGTYTIQLKIQAERDGAPHYRVSLNDTVIRDDRYPYSCGSLGCDVPIWECPDSNKYITVGDFTVNKGDGITFYGAEDFPCGHSHGAYAKWHEITLVPANCK